MPYTPKDVARLLDLPTATLRNWCEEFSDFLSESARGSLTDRGTPAHRRFDEADVAILRRVAYWRNQGLRNEQIREKLKQPAAEEETTSGPATSAVTLREVRALQQVISQQQQQLDDLRSHLEDTRAERERLLKDSDQLRARLAEIEERQRLLPAEADKVRTERDWLRTELERVKADLDAAKARADALETSNRYLQRPPGSQPPAEASAASAHQVAEMAATQAEVTAVQTGQSVPGAVEPYVAGSPPPQASPLVKLWQRIYRRFRPRR